MASILMAACPFRGHVTPTLQLAAGLVGVGHRLRVLTGSRYGQAVVDVGAEHLALPPDADFDEEHLLEDLPGRAELGGLAAARFDMTRIFLDPVPGQLAALDDALTDEPVDVVVAEPLFLAALPLVARRERPPVVTLGTMPPLMRQSAMPPVGPPLDALGPLAPMLHQMAHRLGHAVLFGRVQRHAERVLVAAGEPPPRVPFLDWPRCADSLVQLSVPAFEPIAGVPVPIHHVGTLHDRGDGPTGDAPSWWPRVERAVAARTPIVHVTQGTAANVDLEQLVAPTIRALSGRPVLVVATTGGRDPGRLADGLPDNAVLDRWVDYARLLPVVSAVVTNGGYGGVHEALRHGVPLVLAGAQQDKAAVAARLRRSGAGVAVTTLTPEQDVLDRLVGTVLHDGQYRQAAERIAADVAAAPGLQGAVRVVEDLADVDPP